MVAQQASENQQPLSNCSPSEMYVTVNYLHPPRQYDNSDITPLKVKTNSDSQLNPKTKPDHGLLVFSKLTKGGYW